MYKLGGDVLNQLSIKCAGQLAKADSSNGKKYNFRSLTSMPGILTAYEYHIVMIILVIPLSPVQLYAWTVDQMAFDGKAFDQVVFCLV